MSTWAKRAVVVLSVMTVIVSGAVFVQAQSASDDVINACVGPSGALRVVVEGEPCRSAETPISWGSGLSGYEIVYSDRLFDPDVQALFGSHTVDCPAGKKVLGGGAAALVGDPSDPGLGATGALEFAYGSFPVDENTWAVSFNWTGVAGVGVRVYATCAF